MDIEDKLYEYDSRGPDIIGTEVEWALNNLPIGKAVGVDNIPAKMIKVLQGKARKDVVQLCKDIYSTGVWPEDF